MKELLCVRVSEDQDVSVTTDFEFPESALKEGRFDRQDPLYQKLVEQLRLGNPQCAGAIRMLESARKDARYNYRGLHPELESALRSWRRGKVKELNVPAFIVMHQRVLLGIADAAPQSPDELLAVPGFGPGLYERYGEEILALSVHP